jgi:hypothetical protein
MVISTEVVVLVQELDKLDAVTREELGKNWRVLSFGAIALALFGLSLAGERSLDVPKMFPQCSLSIPSMFSQFPLKVA